MYCSFGNFKAGLMINEIEEVLMVYWLSIVNTDKVIHTMEIDIVKLMVEIKSFGMSFDEFDKETGSSDGLQPNQVDLSCVHALNELLLHEIHVVPKVLMVYWLSIVKTDKVIHTMEIDIVKLMVEIKSFGMSSDEFDKETGSSDGLQPNQVDLSCVHALSELLLHEIHVVPNIFSYEIDIQESYEEIVYRITEVEKEKYPALQEKRYGRVCKMTGERILKDYWREGFEDKEDDLDENLEDPEECVEDKANTIIGAIHDKLKDDWCNGTSEDEDDLEGILDYLEPRSYDGFIDLDDEAYNKRKCGLL
nr:hypothetical protein [Tanacetum cinerariifolium]